MSYKGTATIACVSKEITDELNSMGFSVKQEDVSRLICESDVIGNDDWEAWVEPAHSAPGELERFPHIVYCTQSTEAGSAVNRTYKPVA